MTRRAPALVVLACTAAAAQDPSPIVSKSILEHSNELLERRQWAEALELLQKSRDKIVPHDLWLWWGNQGDALAGLDRLDEALPCFAQAVASEPKPLFPLIRSAAIVNCSTRLLDRRDPRGALAVLQAHGALIVERDRLAYFGNLGLCHDVLRDFPAAVEAYSKAIALRPSSFYRGYRAELLHALGRWDEARADLDADPDIAKAERAGQTHPLRVVVDGPFRGRWPAAWRKFELRSRYGHFHVVSNAGVTPDELSALEARCAALDPANPAQRRELESLCRPSTQLTTIATLLELVRKEYMRVVNMKERDWPKGHVFKVFYFDSLPEYESFTRKLGSPMTESTLGFYSPDYRYLCIYNAPGGDLVYGFSETTMDTFFHEAWHQFYDVLADRPPKWMNEGIAEVMGKSKILDGGQKLQLGLLVKRMGNSRYLTRYESIQRRLAAGQHLPFRQFFRVDHAAWVGGDPDLLYAQAWAVCYWALRGGHEAVRKDFLAMFWGSTRGEPLDRLLATHFSDAKLDAYEKAWLEYMKRL